MKTPQISKHALALQMLAVFLAIAACLFFDYKQHTPPEKSTSISTTVAIREAWEYRWGDSPRDSKGNFVWLTDTTQNGWFKTETPAEFPGRQNESFVWFRTRVSVPPNVVSPALFFPSSNCAFEMFLDDSSVVRFGNLGAEDGAFPGWRPFLINLPPTLKTALLTFRCQLGSVNAGITDTILIGDRIELFEGLIKRNLPALIISVVLALIGLSFVIAGFSQKSASLWLYCGGYTFLAGLLMLARSPIIFLYAPQSPIVLELQLFLAAIYAGVATSMLKFTQPESTFIRIAGKISNIGCFAVLALVSTMALTGPSHTNQILQALFPIFLFLFATMMLSAAFVTLKSKEQTPRTLGAGIFVIALANIYDTATYTSAVNESGANGVSKWMLLTFVILVSLQLMRSFFRSRQEVDAAHQELLAQTQALMKLNKRLVESDKAKDLFLSTINHELRTPMTGILGGIDIISKTTLAPDQERFVSVVRRSANYMMKIVDQILLFSHASSGNLVIKNIPSSPRALLENAIKHIEPSLVEKGLSSLLNISPLVPQVVCCDALRVEQILVNFAANAVKFTKSGHVSFGVTLRKNPNTATQSIVFTVADTGIGLKPEVRERVFERFFQADMTYSREHGGLGLGLAISQELAHLMGGKLEVESEEGKGSTFQLVLPLRTE